MSLTRRTLALESVTADDDGVRVELSKVNPENEKMLDSKDGTVLDGDIKPVQIDIEEELTASSDEDDLPENSSIPWVAFIHVSITGFFENNSSFLKKVLIGLLVGIFAAYFITSIVFHITHHCPEERSVTSLVAGTCVVLFLVSVSCFWSRFGHVVVNKGIKPMYQAINNHWKILRWFAVFVPVLGVIAIIISAVYKNPENLLSLAGLTIFLVVLFMFSAFPSKVNWRPVIGGFILQFYFAALILKWDVGYEVFKTIGEKAQMFLAYTDNGSVFVFGEKYNDHIFAMQVLPVMVFFSCVTSMLYYLGAMQTIISKMAFVMRFTLGTTAAESLCAAANVFVGLTEAPIMIRPFLSLMTKSELHAVMVGGFATIAGGVMAAYIKSGIPPEHLLCASVMNAPCSLAVSKLLYPETKKSKLSKVNIMVHTKR